MNLHLVHRTAMRLGILLLLCSGLALARPADVDTRTGQALGEFLNNEGYLELPKGFSGQIDPSGYRIISGVGQKLRFEANRPDAGQVDERWHGTGTVGNGCNDTIRSSAVDACRQIIYFGGEFRQCGSVAANFIAAFDLNTRTWSALGLGSENGVSGSVRAVAVEGDHVYAGGTFERAGGYETRYVARFDVVNKHWSPLGGATTYGVYGPVNALAISAGELYVGGGFFRAGGLESRNLARFNLETQSWSAVDGGVVGNFVQTLLISGDYLYVGGEFSQAGGIEARGIARLNLLTRVWSSLGSGAENGVLGNVYSIVAIGDEVYAGGFFEFAGGNTANRIAYFNTSTQRWSALVSGDTNGVSGSVFSMAAVGSSIYVGGLFNVANGLNVNRFARFDTITKRWFQLNGGVSAESGVSVRTITAFGGGVYLGGNFDQVGQMPVNFVARFDATQESWSQLGEGIFVGVNHSVKALAVAGDNIYVGGRFTMAGGVRANRVAYFNTVTRSWHALGSGTANGVDNFVYAIDVAGNDVYVGGDFSKAGGQVARRIARFNISSQTWSSLGGGLDTLVNQDVYVNAIAVAGNYVYVGGDFYSVDGIVARSVARFDNTTQTWYPLGNGSLHNPFGGVFLAIAISGSDVYIGGSFTSVDQLLARNIARFSADTGSWSTVGGGPLNGVNDSVYDLAIDGDNLYIGGNFTEAGGTSVNQIVRFNTTSQSWFSLGSGPTNGANGPIFNIAAANGKVYVSGQFSRAGAIGATQLACFTVDAQRWNPLGSGIEDYINDIALLDDQDVVVGGAFGKVGASVTSNLAIYEVGAPATVTLVASSVNAAVNEPFIVSAHVSGALGSPSGEITLIADTDESCTFSAPTGNCELSFALPGNRSIVGVYSGDGDYEAKTSSAVSVVVVPSSDYIFTVGFE